MLQKLKNWMNSRRYQSHTMRLIVGGYIAYLGFDIMLDQYKKGSFDPLLSVIAVLMILLGTPIALLSLYAVVYGYSTEYQGKTNFFRANAKREDEKAEEE